MNKPADTKAYESLKKDVLLFHAADPVLKLGIIGEPCVKEELFTKKEKKELLKLGISSTGRVEKQFALTSKNKVQRQTPTHTLLFAHPNEDTILMTYAKPNLKLGDTYSKEFGRDRVSDRMIAMMKRIDSGEPQEDAIMISLGNILPQRIANTLDFYLIKVFKYFKLSGNETLIFCGDKRTQVMIDGKNGKELSHQMLVSVPGAFFDLPIEIPETEEAIV